MGANILSKSRCFFKKVLNHLYFFKNNIGNNHVLELPNHSFEIMSAILDLHDGAKNALVTNAFAKLLGDEPHFILNEGCEAQISLANGVGIKLIYSKTNLFQRFKKQLGDLHCLVVLARHKADNSFSFWLYRRVQLPNTGIKNICGPKWSRLLQPLNDTTNTVRKRLNELLQDLTYYDIRNPAIWNISLGEHQRQELIVDSVLARLYQNAGLAVQSVENYSITDIIINGQTTQNKSSSSKIGDQILFFLCKQKNGENVSYEQGDNAKYVFVLIDKIPNLKKMSAQGVLDFAAKTMGEFIRAIYIIDEQILIEQNFIGTNAKTKFHLPNINDEGNFIKEIPQSRRSFDYIPFGLPRARFSEINEFLQSRFL